MVVILVCRSFICLSVPEATLPIIPAIFSVTAAVIPLSAVSLEEDAARLSADWLTWPIMLPRLPVIWLKVCAS
ncbi:hypothetical protein D3C80_1963890 [compost metagenome]